jgi:hypothetical protein
MRDKWMLLIALATMAGLNRDPKIRHGTRRRAIHALPSSRKQGVDARPSPSMTWWNYQYAGRLRTRGA